MSGLASLRYKYVTTFYALVLQRIQLVTILFFAPNS